MSETHTSVNIDVRPYRDEDEIKVLNLLSTTMGEGPAGGRTADFFEWKHIRNPFGRSFMLVAESAGRIVGLRAFMRWEFVVGGESLRAVRAVDTATHPDFQRRGIFSKLTSRALDDLVGEADFIFNTPNEKSLPGYLKLGWEVVGKVPLYIRPLRPVSFAAGLRGSNGEIVHSLPEVAADPAASLLHQGQDVDWLLDRAANESTRLQTRRSVAFLRWRYSETPFDYRLVASEGPEGLSGLAIFRVRPRGRLLEASVAELIVDPHADERPRRQLLRDVARAARVDHISIAAPLGQALVMGRAGFLPSPASITLVTRRLGESLPTDVKAKRNWALTLGDIEVF